MAEAYGKLTGKPGLCLVTRGPGATNASIGIHTAMQNSSPMILFIGQVGTDMRGREAFQEIDYQDFYGSIAKEVIEISQVDRIPELFARAWSAALSGRPGPVVVALPEDVLVSRTSVTRCKPVRVSEPAPSPTDIDETIALIKGATKPLVLIGGGGWTSRGCQSMQKFAQNNSLPVAVAFRFQTLFDNTSDMYVGEAGVAMAPALQAMIRQADLILAIGVRFGEMTTAAYSLLGLPHPETTLIHAHASDEELGKVYVADLPLHAGPNCTAEALQNVQIDHVPWRSWTFEARQAYLDEFDAPEQPGSVDMVSVTQSIQERLPADAIVTNGAGNFTVWPNRFLKYGSGQRLLAPQSGAMGYGLPAAIAAKIAEPQTTVVCFAGDGDFQMNCQEMGTAMQANASPIVLVLNNGSYSTIRMHQERHYPGRVSGTELLNPDFVSLAHAYGFHAERVEQTADFPDAFERAMASGTGALIELTISSDALTPRQTLSQIRDSAQREGRQ